MVGEVVCCDVGTSCKPETRKTSTFMNKRYVVAWWGKGDLTLIVCLHGYLFNLSNMEIPVLID